MSTSRWTAADIPTQTGKLAVVTGAISGIGWHTALELARAGAAVVLPARTEAKGRGLWSGSGARFRRPTSVRNPGPGQPPLDPCIRPADQPRRFAVGKIVWSVRRTASPNSRMMLMSELARRSAAAGSKPLSNAAHPGFARTNLQTSGPGRPLSRIEKLMARFMSQDAAHGALPTLRAATSSDAAAQSYYAPERLFQLKGDPILIPLPKPARDEAAAHRLWDTAQALTGVTFAQNL